MKTKKRELLEVLVDKHTNGERLDMLDKKKCVECGKIFNSIGLGDDECFTCSYVTAMIEREYE